MVHTKLIIRAVFGIIGNFLSFGLFASPVPTFYSVIMKSDSLEEVKLEYHLLTMMNCLFLVLYSMPFVHPGSIFLLTANGFGAVMNLAYLIILILYATDKKEKMFIGAALLIELAVIGLLGGLVIGLVHTILMRRTIVGVFCFVCATVMYYPRMFYMFAERTDYLPYPVLVTNTLNDLCWMIYASIRFDPTLWFAYLYRFFVGVLQLAKYSEYSGRPLKFSDDKKLATADVQLQGIGIVDAHKKLATSATAPGIVNC